MQRVNSDLSRTQCNETFIRTQRACWYNIEKSSVGVVTFHNLAIQFQDTATILERRNKPSIKWDAIEVFQGF